LPQWYTFTKLLGVMSARVESARTRLRSQGVAEDAERVVPAHEDGVVAVGEQAAGVPVRYFCGSLTLCGRNRRMGDPHVNGDDLPGNTMALAEGWAAGISGPAYAVDDQTAFKVVDGNVEIVSEGHWRLFSRPSRDPERASATPIARPGVGSRLRRLIARNWILG
jgi:hypothetical protein